MLLPTEPFAGAALIAATFHPEDFPDARLYERVQITADAMLRSAFGEGDERSPKVKRAERRAASRLYANERVKADRLARRAQECSIKALGSAERVLVAHDTSEFDKHGRHEPDDAGPLRSSQARGYLVHYGVLVDPGNQARTGIGYMTAWTRPFPKGKPRPEGKVAVKREWENEDGKWSWGVEQAEKALRLHGYQGQVRHLADNEGSSYASLVKAKRRKRDYVARTKVDRSIYEGSGKLFEYLLEQRVVKGWAVNVEEEPKSVSRGTARLRRTARVELRFAPVTLKVSGNYTGRSYRKGLQVWAVYVYEPNPPPGSERLQWMLLSVKPVKTTADAQEVVMDYTCRWGVEDINKVFKSGCRAELTVVPNLEAFKRLLAVAWPVAVHIARWTYASRVCPNELAAPHVGDEVIEIMKLACRYHDLPLPRRAWTLRDFVLRLAQMGGYEKRKDQLPGWQVIWRGWRVLSNFWDHTRFLRDHEGDTASRDRRRTGSIRPAVRSGPILPLTGSATKEGKK